MTQRGTILPPFGDIWRELQLDNEGNLSNRMIDDEVERKFWREFIKDFAEEGSDPYSDIIWKDVEGILGNNYYDSILEIGPGWGNYTFNLASRCRTLRCVDISSDVLRFIKRKGWEYGFTIETEVSRWEEWSGDDSDVVFAYNCFYRMRDIECCLRKIDEAGSKLHIIGMTSGPEPEYLKDFEEELGLRINYNRLDYIVLVIILYQLGIDCNVDIVKLERDYSYSSITKALKKEASCILSDDYDENDLRRILRRYMKKGDDGLYHYVHRFNAAVIWW